MPNLLLSILLHEKLIEEDNGRYVLTPKALNWIDASFDVQKATIIHALNNDALQPVIGQFAHHYLTFHQQQARKLAPQKSEFSLCINMSPHQITLHIPDSFPSNALFHLLHYGAWYPETNYLTITPASLLNANNSGYSYSFLKEVLGKTMRNLSPKLAKTLRLWKQAQAEVTLSPVYLLHTRDKERMGSFRENKALNKHIKSQLSPTQAIVSKSIEKPLTKVLAQAHIPFKPMRSLQSTEEETSPVLETAWLGIMLADKLATIIPSPPKIKKATRQYVINQLDDHIREDIEHQADALIKTIMTKKKERETAYKAAKPEPYLTSLIEEAIASSAQIAIYYQARRDDFPTWRTVSPLLLHQQEQYHYLHAYCHKAEDSRQFRLDRIQSVKLVSLDNEGVCELSFGIETDNLNALLAFAD